MLTPKFLTIVYIFWWLVDTVLKEITDYTEDNHTCCTFYRHTSQSSRLLACLTILSRFLPCQWIQSSQTWAQASKESTITHCNVCTYCFSPSTGLHSLMTQYLAAYCNSVEKGLPFPFLAWEYCFLQAMLQWFGKAIGHSIGLCYMRRAALRLSPPSPHLCSSVPYKHWRWRVNQVPEEHGSQLFPPLLLRSS